MNWTLELLIIPVTDVDRAKEFYVDRVGFHADHDHRVHDELRFVQLTPTGSGCSIAFGQGLIDTEPGTAQGMQLVVNDIEAAHAHLSANGVDVSDIDTQDWGRFVHFQDPDGNGWSVQEIPTRP